MNEYEETLDRIKVKKEVVDNINPKVFLPFTKDIMLKVISGLHPEIDVQRIKNSPIFFYLLKYFHCESDIEENSGKLKARSILVESKYFSESFLSSLRYYNTTSSTNLSKLNTRIHFFDYTHEDEQFFEHAFLTNDRDKRKEIWDNYLGYITVRPLSGAIFGASFLKPYEEDDNFEGETDEAKRYFNSVIKAFRFDIFGKQIQLDGLPFQAQDISVGSCATYAIWMALFKLNKLFKSKFLSPYEITESAGISTTDVKRIYPSVGMDSRQIFNAIRASGLTGFNFGNTNQNRKICDCCGDFVEEFYEHLEKEHNIPKNVLNKIPRTNDYTSINDIGLRRFKKIVYAYNKMGIPILMAYSFKNPSTHDSHIVTISGFKTNKSLEINTDDKTHYSSDNIVTIYAHNDNNGPYEKFVPRFSKKDGLLLDTFSYKDDAKKQIEVKPELIFVPVDKNIKIQDQLIFRAIDSIDRFVLPLLKEAFNEGNDREPVFKASNFEWDIYLDFAINYKQSFFKNKTKSDYDKKIKEKILFTNFPKYIWIARLKTRNDKSHIDFIFDASSLPTEKCLFQINFINKISGVLFVECFKKAAEVLEDSPEKSHLFDEGHLSFIKKSALILT